jgi:membrane associated rhomboid family serine protease
MGIHDRDYYRDDDGGFFANWSRSAQVTKSLMVLTAAIFVIQLATKPAQNLDHDSGAFTRSLELVGSKVLFQGEVWRLITSGFLHNTGDIFHILFNMLFLWFVGRELEERYGPREFLAFYLVALVVSALVLIGTTALKLNGSTLNTSTMAGSSGAVTAALLVFILHAPNRRILLFFVIPMPIWVLGVLFVGRDFVVMLFSKSADSDPSTRVAFAAHLGGAAFGALYFLARIHITAWLPSWPIKAAQRAQPRLRVRHEEDAAEPELPEEPPMPPPPVKSEADLDEQLEAQLDAVLAKVAKQGQASLTSSERAILKRASELYRRRRR